MRKLLLAVVLLSVVHCAFAREVTAPRYSIVDLTAGEKEKSQSVSACALNNKGEVVGRADGRAFVWRAGKMEFIGSLPASTSCTPSGINDKDEIVGRCEFPYNDENRGSFWPPAKYFLWKDGKMQNLGETPLFFESIKINNRSQVIMGAPAVLWERGRKKVLGSWIAAAINDNGQIAGARLQSNKKYTSSADELVWAVVWGNGLEVSIGSNRSWAILINNQRDIVVEQIDNTEGNWRTRTYLIQNGKEIVVIPWGKITKSVKSINDQCQIVGWVSVPLTKAPSSRIHAALWQSDKWQDLNECISPNSGWILESANDINERGQIVGVGKYQGVLRAFLLTPIPAATAKAD